MPIISFRQQYSNVRLHISISDSILAAISDPINLISYLSTTQSASLNVVISPWTNISVLKMLLNSYQKILNDNYFGLTVSIDSKSDIDAFIQERVIESVDYVFFIPSNYDISDKERSRILNELPTSKLVMGLSSVVFNIDTVTTTIPSYSKLCQNLQEWKPEIMEEGQIRWSHPNKSWSFWMRMGPSVEEEVNELRRWGVAGIVIHDISLEPQVNPTCAKHREFFLQSIRRASTIHVVNPLNVRVKRAESKSSRLGKVLIFAVGDEEEKFKKYYSVADNDSLLNSTSPVNHIVLGYDGSGRIYDIYQQMPSQLSTESIFRTIHLYYIDQLISGSLGPFAGAELPPPSIIIYPDASGTHPIPILITWVRMRNPAERLALRKTRKPASTTSTTPSSAATEIITTTTESMTAPFTTTCGDGNFQCTTLMEVLNPKKLSTTSTTRKPTTPRTTTPKPAIPLNPLARFPGEEDLVSAPEFGEND